MLSNIHLIKFALKLYPPFINNSRKNHLDYITIKAVKEFFPFWPFEIQQNWRTPIDRSLQATEVLYCLSKSIHSHKHGCPQQLLAPSSRIVQLPIRWQKSQWVLPLKSGKLLPTPMTMAMDFLGSIRLESVRLMPICSPFR